MIKPRFKVGDRVVYARQFEYLLTIPLNTILEILDIDGDFTYRVSYKEMNRGLTIMMTDEFFELEEVFNSPLFQVMKEME